MTLEEGFSLIINKVAKQEKHEHYQRTVDLSEKMYALATGENLKPHMEKYFASVSEESRDKIAEVTQAITPSVIHQLMRPVKGVLRLNDIREIVKYSTPDTEKEIQLIDSISNFYGSKSVSKYMAKKWVSLSTFDPNSFILVDFESFDSTVETAKPYPVEIPSKSVFDFKYENQVLKYLMIEKASTYVNSKGAECQGFSYSVYIPDYAIKLVEVDPETSASETPEITKEGLIKINSKVYSFEVLNTKSKVVQAVRTGFIDDLITHGETMTTFLHPALPWLEKLLKSMAEFDLTNLKHVFPQLLAYMQKCEGDNPEIGCGCDKHNTEHYTGTCDTCEGSGWLMPTTSGEVTAFKLPLEDDPELLTDLSKLYHYIEKPLELIELQLKINGINVDSALAAMYSNEKFTRLEVSETATKSKLDADATNDAVQPLVEHYSDVWVSLVTLIAEFTDKNNGDLIISHHFPKDLKLKTQEQIAEERKAAKEAGINPILLAKLDEDFNDKVHINSPDEAKKCRVKMSYDPFRGLSLEERMHRLSMSVPERDRILYSNFESIFRRIEKDHEDFYSYERPKMDETVEAVIADFIQDIQKERVSEFGLIDTGEGIETPVDVETE